MKNVYWVVYEVLIWGMDQDWMGGHGLQAGELEADLQLRVLDPIARSFRPVHLAAHGVFEPVGP